MRNCRKKQINRDRNAKYRKLEGGEQKPKLFLFAFPYFVPFSLSPIPFSLSFQTNTISKFFSVDQRNVTEDKFYSTRPDRIMEMEIKRKKESIR